MSAAVVRMRCVAAVIVELPVIVIYAKKWHRGSTATIVKKLSKNDVKSGSL